MDKPHADLEGVNPHETNHVHALYCKMQLTVETTATIFLQKLINSMRCYENVEMRTLVQKELLATNRIG